jgi:hypothetical protein
MANTYKALQTFTIGAGGASSVDFTNIPQTYTDLKVVISGRNTDSGNNFQAVLLAVNNDGTAGSWRLLWGQNGAAFSGTNSGYLQPSFTSSAANTSNTFSNAEIYFPNYASNSTAKSFSSDFVTENNSSSANANIYGFYSNLWNNTTPINRLTFTSNISNFVQYTTFTLYGVFNADVSSAPSTPNIGTASDGGTGTSASVTFTGVANAASYTMTSSPGSLTATGTTSPITVRGLTTGTAYTFTCTASNPFGTSGASSASNSVTPVTPTSFESIATITATGGETSLSFTSIPSSYVSIQIRALVRTSRALEGTDSMVIRFNSDSGANYSTHQFYGNGTSPGVYISTSDSSAVIQNSATIMNGSLANSFAGNIIDIHDYASTTKTKTMRAFSGGEANNASTGFIMGLASASWRSTSAITSITFTNGFGFQAGSVFSLYGIKGA